MKKNLFFILTLILCLGAAVPVTAVEEPTVPRVFALDMNASLGEYNGTEYIVLDIGVVDITDDYGIASVEFDIQFDGDKLVPLWQTNTELNGDGTSVGIPQMVVAWPTYEATQYIPGYGLYTVEKMAVEGLCKNYGLTGKGKLNVNLVMNTDHCREAVTEDNEIKVRLYFTPVDGFENGATYKFIVDGDYDIGLNMAPYITLAGTSGLVLGDFEDRLQELRIYGYGDEATVKVRGTSSEEPDDPSSSVPDDPSSSVPQPEPPVVTDPEIGDVNCDGVVDSLDAALVLRYDAFLEILSEDQLVLGDVDGDGFTDSLDAAFILRYDAFLIIEFPAEG